MSQGGRRQGVQLRKDEAEQHNGSVAAGKEQLSKAVVVVGCFHDYSIVAVVVIVYSFPSTLNVYFTIGDITIAGIEKDIEFPLKVIREKIA